MPYRWTLTDLVAPYVGSEVLSKDPIGWDDAIININRSEQYKGMNTIYTNSLKFHCNGGGKEYIDAIYQSEGIDGRIDVLIEYDCDGSGTYDTLFNGIINLASYKTDGEYTICNIEQSDLHTKLAMRDEISVNLESTASIGGSPITAPASQNVSLHSQNLYLKSSMEGDVPFSSIQTNNMVDAFTYKGYFTSAFNTTRMEAETFVGSTETNDFGFPGHTASDTEIPEIFIANDPNVQYPQVYTYTLQFAGLFSDIITSIQTRVNTAHALSLRYGQEFNTATTVTLYNSTGYSGSATTLSIAFDTTLLSANITLDYGDKIWLVWFESELLTTGPYNSTITYQWDYTTANFTLEANSTTDRTLCKSFLVHEAFNQIADSIADGDGHFYSDFYGRTDSEKISYSSDGCGSPISISNGLNIRQFPDKPITASFRQLFSNFDCLHNIGMAIESNKVRIEPLSYWFDGTTKIISLPNVANYEQKCDNKRFINKIDIGYQKWESEFRGGLDEVNTKHEYSTIISSVKNTLTKLCSYIASGYTIEFTRRKKYTDETTTDWRYDNDCFLIAVKRKFTGQIGFLVQPADDDNINIFGIELTSIQVGDTIIISNTALNNGTYTVTYVLTQNNNGTNPITTLKVAEALQTELFAYSGTIEDVNNPFYTSEQYQDSFSYGSGMTSIDTAYNLRITPARMLLAHFNVISAGLQLIRGMIKFIKGEGNTTLAVAKDIIAYTEQCEEDYSSQVLSESQSFNWNDSNVKNVSPLWLPETYTFEYPLSYSQFKAIKANPYGYIEFYKFSDNVMNGFILNMEYKMKTGLTKFELLRKF